MYSYYCLEISHITVDVHILTVVMFALQAANVPRRVQRDNRVRSLVISASATSNTN
jgi:hypothetical protein